jgi:hypothetical protein
MVHKTVATQRYLQPFEGATGWGVFLPGDAPPQLATPLAQPPYDEWSRGEERFIQRGMNCLIASLKEGSTDIIGLGLSGFSGRVGLFGSVMAELLGDRCDSDDPEHQLNSE